MRNKWTLAFGLLLLTLSVFAGASIAGAEGPSPSAEGAPASGAGEVSPALDGCEKGHACVWPKKNKEGTIGQSLCTGGVHTLGGDKLSGRNECDASNKFVAFRRNGNLVQCLGAGASSNEFSPAVNELFVEPEGQTHC